MSDLGLKTMRSGWILACAACVAGLLALGLVPQQARVSAASGEGEARRPVLVELFTSEGCSSCPPADALLAKLDAAQPVAGAQVIVLSEHVTYWDRLGWRDPFSLAAMTQRQNQYASQFGLDSVYTPQVVVDGAAQMVGSDERKLVSAVAKAAGAPKVELTITEARVEQGAVHFSVHGGAHNSGVLLVGAMAEDAVTSAVERGENGGRTLKHVAVVRAMQPLGDGNGPLTLPLPAVSSANASGGLRLVVFLVERGTGHVLGVAEQTLKRG